jgi:hypothetical protein
VRQPHARGAAGVSRRSCSACRLMRVLSCCSLGPPRRNSQRKTRSTRGDGSDNSCNHHRQCRARCCASLRARVPHVARKTFEAPHRGSDHPPGGCVVAGRNGGTRPAHRGDHPVGWGKHSDREPRQRKAALRPTLALRLRVAAERSAGGVCQDVCCGSRPTERTTRALSLRANSDSATLSQARGCDTLDDGREGAGSKSMTAIGRPHGKLSSSSPPPFRGLAMRVRWRARSREEINDGSNAEADA